MFSSPHSFSISRLGCCCGCCRDPDSECSSGHGPKTHHTIIAPSVNLPATEAMSPASSSAPDYSWRKACLSCHAWGFSFVSPQVIDDLGHLHYQRTHTPEEVAAQRARGRPRQSTLMGRPVNKRGAADFELPQACFYFAPQSSEVRTRPISRHFMRPPSHSQFSSSRLLRRTVACSALLTSGTTKRSRPYAHQFFHL